MDMSLKYYLKINPDQLTDEEWSNNIALLAELRSLESKTKQ